MHKLTRAVLSGLLLTGLAAATPAFADTIDNFLITDYNGDTYSFQLPSSPTVSGSNANYDFDVTGVEISFDGGIPAPASTYFFTITVGAGGMAITGSGLNFNDPGQQLFTGSVTSPTFITGTYTLDNDSAPQNPKFDATLTISPATTPEPGSLALLGTGMLGLVGMVRRRFVA